MSPDTHTGVNTMNATQQTTIAQTLIECSALFEKQHTALQNAVQKAVQFLIASGVKQVTPTDRAEYFALAMSAKVKKLHAIEKKDRTESETLSIKAEDNRLRQQWHRLCAVLAKADIEIIKDARGGKRDAKNASAPAAGKTDKQSAPTAGKQSAPSAPAANESIDDLAAIAAVAKLVALYSNELGADAKLVLHALGRVKSWVKNDA